MIELMYWEIERGVGDRGKKPEGAAHAVSLFSLLCEKLDLHAIFFAFGRILLFLFHFWIDWHTSVLRSCSQ